jgi:hypothetical protein
VPDEVFKVVEIFREADEIKAIRALMSSVEARAIEKGVVPAAGFEPATFGSGDQRSNPLSYAGNAKNSDNG